MKNWYSVDEFNTLYNYSYNDIKIKIDDSYELRVEIDENKPETNKMGNGFFHIFLHQHVIGILVLTKLVKEENGIFSLMGDN